LVEAAGDEDERSSDGDDSDRRGLEREVLHVRPGEEDRARERERDEQRDECDDNAVIAHDREVDAGQRALRARLQRGGFGRHAASSPPVANAAWSTASSLIVFWSNSATSRPARITSTRCARPSSSSCSEEISSTAMPDSASCVISS